MRGNAALEASFPREKDGRKIERGAGTANGGNGPSTTDLEDNTARAQARP